MVSYFLHSFSVKHKAVTSVSVSSTIFATAVPPKPLLHPVITTDLFFKSTYFLGIKREIDIPPVNNAVTEIQLTNNLVVARYERVQDSIAVSG